MVVKILDILLNSVSHRDGTQIKHICKDSSMYAVNGGGHHFKIYYLIWRNNDVVGVTKMYFFLYHSITSNYCTICYWISVYIKIHYFTNRLLYLVFIFGLFNIPKWGVNLWHFCHFSMRLCLVLRRRQHSFSLIHCSQIVNITWILFPRRLNHVCSIVFFSTGSFELHFCGISQTTLCEDFSRWLTELIC